MKVSIAVHRKPQAAPTVIFAHLLADREGASLPRTHATVIERAIQAMNQLAEALTKAGVQTPEQRLKDIALKALVKHASRANYSVAATDEIWEQVQKDRLLLIALFNPYGEYRNAIGLVLHRLKQEIALDEARGHIDTKAKKTALKIVHAEREEERREQEEQRRADRAEQARHDAEYQEYLASWHKTPLFDVTISGKPFWEVSAGTVRAWLPTQRRKLRALEMLIDGLPDDGRPIEFYRTPDDVREIWRILGEGIDC